MAHMFNYKSHRAEKARLALTMGGIWQSLLVVMAVLLVLLGVGCLILQITPGWFILSLAAVPLMIFKWYKDELLVLSHADASTAIEDVLEKDILARLSVKPTPFEIASIIGSISSGHFFAARFGISAQFVQQFASHDPLDMQLLWDESWAIMEKTKSVHISSGIILVALLEAMPSHDSLLARMQLDMSDLYEGIHWYHNLHKLINKKPSRKKTGGIARDWSFGWIPTLTRFGTNLSESIGDGGFLLAELETHASAVDQLVSALSTGTRKNAALIGPTGSGKTEIVHAFAEKLLNGNEVLPASLLYSQVFLLDASSLISAAPGRGELEQLMTRLLNEAYSAKNIIICLEDAQLFFEEGIGSVDISSLLLPVLSAGVLPLILTMDEQRFLKISQTRPELTNVLNRINIKPASKEETIAVLEDQIIFIEFKQNVTYMYQSLLEAYRLSERYIHDLAMPGRALRLLEVAGSYAEDGLVTAASIQQAVEKTMNIKVGTATNEQERDMLLNLETLIHKRMINQVNAVSAVSDALRRARAGVRNQDRPIGTFMFLGPTGVGKTELAKALAAVYFGGEEHLIRVDMNEFVTQNDVARLIADGADDANSLTARVMKQPFSVILLDEIEKAHPSVLTTLLQVLDEGILRDVKNREVSFKDAIIIATSNAGADRIREYIAQGYDLDKIQDQFVDELINSNQFRPEFLNRFDEIVTFKPLQKPELIQVVDLMIADVNKTLAPQKIQVNVDQDAKDYLVEAGYDPRLGARPMRRVVQKAVENTVAKQMLSGTVGVGSVITINLEQVQSMVSKKQQADDIVQNKI